MPTLKVKDLNSAVRTFLSQLLRSNRVVVEDDRGEQFDLTVRRLTKKSTPRSMPADLPRWSGKVFGELHRRDIYDHL